MGSAAALWELLLLAPTLPQVGGDSQSCQNKDAGNSIRIGVFTGA